MENEIKVGEYVRTKDGFIGKYVKDGLRKGTIEVEDNMVSWIVDNSNILKCSKNLIDLIEEGDYVNGELIDFISISKEGNKRPLIRDNIFFFNKYKDIQSIVTKEQFESISYKVTEM